MPPTTIRCSDHRRTNPCTSSHPTSNSSSPRPATTTTACARPRQPASPPSRCGARPGSSPLDAQGPARAQGRARGDRHAADRPARRAAHAVHDPAVGPLGVLPQARRGRRDRALPRARPAWWWAAAPDSAAGSARCSSTSSSRSTRRPSRRSRARASRSSSSRSTCGSTTPARCWTAPREGVYVARGVDSPYFGVLYDIYHSAVEGEDMAAELANAGSIIKYVQLADAPGRGEPGTGSTRLARHARDAARAPATTGRSASSTTRTTESSESRSATSSEWRRRHERAPLPGRGRRRHRRQRPGRRRLRPHPERAGAGRHDRDVRGRPDRDEPARRAREEHRRSRRARPRADALGGSARAGERRSHRRHRQDHAAPRPTGHVPARERLPGRGRGRPARGGHVEQRRRHGRALDRRVPAAERQRADRVPRRRRSSTSCSPRRSGCWA